VRNGPAMLLFVLVTHKASAKAARGLSGAGREFGPIGFAQPHCRNATRFYAYCEFRDS